MRYAVSYTKGGKRLSAPTTFKNKAKAKKAAQAACDIRDGKRKSSKSCYYKGIKNPRVYKVK